MKAKRQPVGSEQRLVRQRRELFLLYLGSLGLALLTVALVVRGITRQIELAETRSQLAPVSYTHLTLPTIYSV